MTEHLVANTPDATGRRDAYEEWLLLVRRTPELRERVGRLLHEQLEKSDPSAAGETPWTAHTEHYRYIMEVVALGLLDSIAREVRPLPQ